MKWRVYEDNNIEKAIEYCEWLIDKCNDGEAIDEFDISCIIEILEGRE